MSSVSILLFHACRSPWVPCSAGKVGGCAILNTPERQERRSLKIFPLSRAKLLKEGFVDPWAVICCSGLLTTHSTERRKTSTLRLYSQQLASYHLAQDSESSLAPPECGGGHLEFPLACLSKRDRKRKRNCFKCFSEHWGKDIFTIEGHLAQDHSSRFLIRFGLCLGLFILYQVEIRLSLHQAYDLLLLGFLKYLQNTMWVSVKGHLSHGNHADSEILQQFLGISIKHFSLFPVETSTERRKSAEGRLIHVVHTLLD